MIQMMLQALVIVQTITTTEVKENSVTFFLTKMSFAGHYRFNVNHYSIHLNGITEKAHMEIFQTGQNSFYFYYFSYEGVCPEPDVA